MIPLLGMAVLAFLLAFALPAQYSETFLGGFAGKMDTLRNTEGRRIILCGGSGAAFAVRSDLLEEELPGYSVINLGMYAGLGSTVPLNAAVRECREGDIILFLPEQSLQTLSLFFSAEAMWQAADGHWQLLGAVRREQWPSMLAQLPYFAAQKAQFRFRGTSPSGDGIYTRDAFNRQGDIESGLRDQNTMPGGSDPNMPVTFDPSLLQDDFLGYINDYAAACTEKGVGFYFTFCPMNAAAVDPEGIDEYGLRLRDALACPVLGSPRESILDSVWFFDTNFHLNSSGAVLYTAKLAGQLKRALGIPGEVGIRLPDIPGGHTAAVFPGDNKDENCFRYAEVPDGWSVTGLTEEGAGRESLTVPVSHFGKPVIGFSDSAFAGNPVIRSVTIQKNIHMIPDGAFERCRSLQTIILQDVSPSACTVGSGLLRGTDALIMVSAESASAFKTNYFWSVYAPRIRAYSGEAVSSKPSAAGEPAAAGEAVSEPAAGQAAVRYDGNGGFAPDGTGVLEVPVSEAHLRMNSLQGTSVFSRTGHALLGWNTSADGSGTEIGLGSRFTPEPGMTLYARWEKETDPGAFEWESRDLSVRITGYHGEDACCVIPSAIGGPARAGNRRRGVPERLHAYAGHSALRGPD